MKTQFVMSQVIAQNIKTFYFKPERPVHYLAGQYTEIRLQHAHPDDRGVKRWFTVSAAPTEPLLAVTTKFSDKGSTFKQTLSKLKPGQAINLAEPMGDFVLPKDKSIPLLFVAAGMGITPIRSMIKYLLDSHEKRNVYLIYAVANEDDFAFLDLFKKYVMRTMIIVESPSAHWKGETGSLNVERIMATPGFNKYRVYLSGPEPMIETFVKDFKQKGIAEDQLVTDYFPGYKAF